MIKKKIIEVEAGISINDLLVEILPKTYFYQLHLVLNIFQLGMVASDVHGKNHHETGSFRNFIISLKIIDENEIVIHQKLKIRIYLITL